MDNQDRPVFVVGHKNPDTDSICAAITYSNLKRITTGGNYRPMRAGELNGETRYVLKHFGVEEPELLTDVRTQVEDMEIRRLKGVKHDLSLKNAWGLMRDGAVVTLSITKDDNRLEGVISMSDIVKSYMDILDSRILTHAKTSYRNIVETLDGTMLVGDLDGVADEGKVVIAAGNPEMMEQYIDEHDLVILGNRYENQLCAIELDASCLIVCGESNVAKTIQHMADSHGCRIITTPHDTFTTARLINQSMSIRNFMKKANVITFRLGDYIEDVQKVMAKERFRYFPVLDEENRYVGQISRRNFLGARKKQVILVDHNEQSQAVNGIDSADLLEIIDHHRLGTMQTMGPVYFRNQPVGCTCTIIRQMYLEQGVAIDPVMAGLMCSAILSDTLLYRSPTCTEIDKQAGKALAAIAGIKEEEFAKAMFRAGSSFSPDKPPEEILFQDFKRFSMSGLTVGIGQVNAMGNEELDEICDHIRPIMEETRENQKLDMIVYMFTNIPEESSRILCVGENAGEAVKGAFQTEAGPDGLYPLPGVGSRRKQMVPMISESVARILTGN